MKKGISVIAAALMLLVASVVWYSCKKEEIVVTGSIFGTVTDFATGNPIGNANVKLRPGGLTTLTGGDGTYEFTELTPGKYSLFLSKAEYADLDDDYVIELESGQKAKRDVQLRKKIASLKIIDMDGNPLDTLDFGDEESVNVKTFNIFNDGTEKLTCTTNYECEWITNVSGLEGEVQSGQTVPVTVRIDRVALQDGVNTTFLYITSGNGSNGLVLQATFCGTAVITTQQPTNVTANSATVGGNISDDGGRPVTARGICYGTSQTPDVNGDHTEDGSGTGTFSHNITELSASTTYYARAYATNRNGTYYSSNIVSFTTSDGMPTVTTAAVTEVAASTAKCGGEVTNNGGYNVTARGVCWNTMGSPDLSNSHTTNGNGNGSFISNITGLAIGTTYHVRAYATNQMGTSYGEERVFATPNGDITIAISNPTDITAQSAVCTANITSDGGVPIADKGICWSTSQFPMAEGQHVSMGMGSGTFTVTLNSLQPSTTYYVRAYGVNQAGTTYSSQISFTTTNGLPVVSTAAVTNITANSARSGGNITDNGGFNVTARGVCWNTMGNPDINESHTTNGIGNGGFEANITGLVPNTTYHVRAYATNQTGTVYGEDITFTTGSGLPQVSTSGVGNVTATSAVCGGNVTDDGGFNVSARGVCWNTVGNPDINASHTTNGIGTGTFTANITGLTPGVTYHVRAYATNSTGTVYGSEQTFTTSDGMPQVTTSSVGNITATSAVCGGNVTDDGGFNITARGVCWNTVGNPDLNASHTTNGIGTGAFTANITGLAPGATYHVRAYATNSTGTVYGEDLNFTTSDGVVSLTISQQASNILGESATLSGNIASDGGAAITERGVCYGTTQYPSIGGLHVSAGSGTGNFSCNITGLSPATTYYARGYAVNSAGVSYSSQMSFTTASGNPNVGYFDYTELMATSATGRSTVTTGGGVPLTGRGVCWSTSPNPTVTGNHTSGGTSTGNLVETLTGLTPNTMYYTRVYATTSYGTYYGSQRSFTTPDGMATISQVSSSWSGDSVLQVTVVVSSDGGYQVTSRGICYNHTGSPTINSTCMTNGTGTGTFTISLPINRTQGTYYIRAFATNTNGTVYGDDNMTLTVTHPYNSLPTFTYNGHVYKVAPDPGVNLSYVQSEAYCNGLTLYGKNDWRMPTEEEMSQMCALKNVIGGFSIYGDLYLYLREYYVYWTSTPVSGETGRHKLILMGECVPMQSNDSQIIASGEISGVEVHFFMRVRPIRVDQ